MTRFDRVIPPGGEGKATLKVDLRGLQGRVDKTATIHSNDPRQPTLLLTLQGRVRPLIEVRPGPQVLFSSAAQNSDEKTLELVSTGSEFKVLKVENGLEGKIRTQLETVEAGKQYRLRITNLKKEGSYSGVVRCLIDLPKKSEILIRVNGHFPPPR